MGARKRVAELVGVRARLVAVLESDIEQAKKHAPHEPREDLEAKNGQNIHLQHNCIVLTSIATCHKGHGSPALGFVAPTVLSH